ncbi:MAG TPA: ribonuclease H-like domain-containing protein [Candidatus Saccharimonadales bacterium]|nr:ribonuclease H-like domain-containing protein [Candidatus Saccharimonadales bacterium]
MKTLIYDIETAPIIGTTWGKYEQNLIWTIQDWYLLSFAYKWLGDKHTKVIGLDDFALYKKQPENDIMVVKELHKLFDEADVIIAHNGDQFDKKMVTTRFMIHKLTPPSPYKTIDTKKVAKRYARFTSNKLDDLGESLQIGHKLDTGGAELWKACMRGDQKAWRKMKRYNKQDVVLLEKLYLELRPWIDNHPGVNIYDNRPDACPKCGGAVLTSQGTARTKTALYRQFKCKTCGGWCRQRQSEKTSKMVYVN